VLAVQDTQPGYFDENDIKALRAIAAQLASTIENANLLLTLHGIPNPLMRKEPSTPSKSITFIKGISASAGTVFGKSTTIGHLQASGDACPWPSSATLSDFRRALAATGGTVEQAAPPDGGTSFRRRIPHFQRSPVDAQG
jgi:phosphotransferase system enzyme I (PtsP)